MSGRSWWGPLALACASILAAIVMWGFTVDDALISIRYARHLASGAGYRFNVGGPATDGVTPLPWPFLVALIARGAPLGVLTRLKVIGIALNAIAMGVATARARDVSLRRWLTAIAATLVCLPLAAYGASGMETPLATLLCGLCVFYMKDVRAAIFAGLAASVRPELLPWAAAIAIGFAIAQRASPRAIMTNAVVAAIPFLSCAIARRFFFGHFAPLAVLAKPSDAAHGLAYAGAALFACGLPILLVTTRGTPASRAITVAFVVHVLAVIAAGGDSMPYARLFVPVLPTLVASHVYSANVSPAYVFWPRSAIAIALAAWSFLSAGPRGRSVMRDRRELVSRAEPVLARSHVVAAVDIGWVSAAFEGSIVDLAGLTDPEIAALPGGHTSKHVDASMLLDRGVDTVVFYVENNFYTHAVAMRLASDALFASRFVESANLPLDEGRGYVVFTRRVLASRASSPSQRSRRLEPRTR